MGKGHHSKRPHKYKNRDQRPSSDKKKASEPEAAEPEDKPVAPEPTEEATGPVLWQWSDPFPDPDGGPFSWRVRLTPGGYEWEISGSKPITPLQLVSPWTQSYMFYPSGILAPSYVSSRSYAPGSNLQQSTTSTDRGAY
ncbi:hypothetical protein DL765_001733 [Monosporascus sp. GIB2]|nr:hypothetical protein DL765_001733 [Monosporascus sp. GIB2]